MLQYLVIADDDVYINLPGLAKSLGQGKKEASKTFFILGFKLFLNSSNLIFYDFQDTKYLEGYVVKNPKVSNFYAFSRLLIMSLNRFFQYFLNV